MKCCSSCTGSRQGFSTATTADRENRGEKTESKRERDHIPERKINKSQERRRGSKTERDRVTESDLKKVREKEKDKSNSGDRIRLKDSSVFLFFW